MGTKPQPKTPMPPLTVRRASAGEDGAPAKLPAGKRARGSAARAQRTADKNRQAQKRYRERQSAHPSTQALDTGLIVTCQVSGQSAQGCGNDDDMRNAATASRLPSAISR